MFLPLQAHEDGGYIKLVVKEECKDHVPGPVQRVLKSFHTEVREFTIDPLKNIIMLEMADALSFRKLFLNVKKPTLKKKKLPYNVNALEGVSCFFVTRESKRGLLERLCLLEEWVLTYMLTHINLRSSSIISFSSKFLLLN